MEYPSRIQQEHVEEVKWDHLYKGLSPEYWQTLAHQGWWWKSCHLFWIALTAWKLERWAEARDPPTTGSSNVTHSHSQGNLFPAKKLKGNCTFTAQSTALEDCKTDESAGPKPSGEKKAKSCAEEDVGMTGEVCIVDPLLGFITWFTNVVELYQKRNHNCYGCDSPDHLVKDCPKEMGKTTRMVGLNLKKGMAKKRDWSSEKLVATQDAILGDAAQA